MTFLTNFRAILFEKSGFSVKLAQKMHLVCPPGKSENLKIDENVLKRSYNMIKVRK